MDALNAIMTRRSVRHFTDQPVEDTKVEQLLRAAMAAPSAGNQQPWRFVTVTDIQTLEALSAATPYAPFLPKAPLAIVVCSDESVEKHVGFWVQDCSIATQNILLAAHAIGLGGVWLGFYPVHERVAAASQVLGLPESVKPLSVLAIGYPMDLPEPVDRFDPGKVHAEKW